MIATLAQTPLHDWHAEHGGRMVEFGGWSMPVQYTSILAEHQATRRAAGLFDISHMGRIRFDGPDAARFLDSLLTRRVDNLKPGGIRYSLVTNDAGGVKDDVLVYHLRDGAGGSYHLLVVNAINREKILGWIEDHHGQFPDASVTDLTHQWAMIAVQGPLAVELVRPLVDHDVAAMKYYTGVETVLAGHGGIISRTGYTGEDGFELIVGNAVVEQLWETLATGSGPGVLPAGLGARDTLRLEAGMPLYGHELNEELNPFQAGLNFAVNLENRQFSGRDALLKAQADQSLPRLVGLELEGKRPAREGYAIFAHDEPVGRVTSGTFSPTFQKPIAMGYVPPRYTAAGTKLTIDIRGQAAHAAVVPLPFYRRPQ
jgi:aminomethyltransferase